MALADARQGRSILFSLKHRFPPEWFRFLTVGDPILGDHIQKFAASADLLPFYLRGQKVKIKRLHLMALPKSAALPVFDLFATPPGAVFDNVKDKVPIGPDIPLQPALHGTRSWLAGTEPGFGEWTLRIRAADFAIMGAAVEGILVGFEFGV